MWLARASPRFGSGSRGLAIAGVGAAGMDSG
jgi:hypothetical protein